MDNKLEQIIDSGAKQIEIEKYLKDKGMVFLRDDAQMKISKGITTKEEAEREVSFSTPYSNMEA